MDIVLLAIGPDRAGAESGDHLTDQHADELADQMTDELTVAGASAVETRAAWTAADVDAVLGDLGPRRLVLDADLAGLNLALARMLRAGVLDTAETAVLPRGPVDQVEYLRRIGLPSSRVDQVAVAVAGECRLVGVIKDDSGGVCVDNAALSAWPDDQPDPRDPRRGWWLRAVVDDQRLVDGQARSVTVHRRGPAELEATVRLGRFRHRTLRGRSLQLACDPALVVQDGIPRERPRGKRTLWSEPALWRLAL